MLALSHLQRPWKNVSVVITPPFFKMNNNCQLTCLTGYWQDESDRTCKKCLYNVKIAFQVHEMTTVAVFHPVSLKKNPVCLHDLKPITGVILQIIQRKYMSFMYKTKLFK